MPSNATLKAFQLDWGKSNNIFPVLLLQKKKKKKKKKNAGMTYQRTRWLAQQESTKIIVWMMYFLQK